MYSVVHHHMLAVINSEIQKEKKRNFYTGCRLWKLCNDFFDF
jgi:hypothetical protein